MLHNEKIIGNALDVMQDFVADQFGAVVTSPPYNIGVDYGIYDDKLSQQDYNEFTRAWVTEALRVAPVVAVNFGNPTSKAANKAHFMLALSEVGVIQAEIIWVKSITIGDTSTGHFKPVNSKRFLNNLHESIFIVSRNGDYPLDRLAVGVPFVDKSNIGRFSANSADVRCRGNVWFLPYQTRTTKLPHPATYPVQLAEMMIKLLGCPLAVLDPFSGVGTTAEAAANLGGFCVGIDLRDWKNIKE